MHCKCKYCIHCSVPTSLLIYIVNPCQSKPCESVMGHWWYWLLKWNIWSVCNSAVMMARTRTPPETSVGSLVQQKHIRCHIIITCALDLWHPLRLNLWSDRKSLYRLDLWLAMVLNLANQSWLPLKIQAQSCGKDQAQVSFLMVRGFVSTNTLYESFLEQ